MPEEVVFTNEDKISIEDKLDEAERLLASRRFVALKSLLDELEPADIAILLGRVGKDEIPLLFRILPKELAADTFVELDGDDQKLLIGAFSDSELTAVLSQLFIDDTVDIIEEMPANVVHRILANVPRDRRAAINEVMNYPDDSAGSIMTIEFIDLREDMTVEDAFKRIRHIGLQKETIYTCYVTDSKRHLLGVVTALDLMTSNRSAPLADLMETNVISASTTDNKEDVGKLFRKYDFLALPVVDKENRLVGIVTVDDALDVLVEATEEDFAKMAAIAAPTEKPYLRTGVFALFRSRIFWLLFLMISSTFTGLIINSFESSLAAVAALTAFIPMLMGTGGNSGSQSSVTIIRAISLDEVQFADIPRIIWKEFRVSILCGAVLSCATFAKIILLDNLLLGENIPILVAIVVSITVCFTVIIAKFIGCVLPMLAKKLGADPAVMASPFITTIVDAVSLLIYFAVASALLEL